MSNAKQLPRQKKENDYHQYKVVKDCTVIPDDTLRPWVVNKSLDEQASAIIF